MMVIPVTRTSSFPPFFCSAFGFVFVFCWSVLSFVLSVGG